MPSPSRQRSKLSAQFWSYIKFVTVLCGVWLVGFHGLSVAWTGVISVFVYIWLFENQHFSLMHPLASLQAAQHSGAEQTVWLTKVFGRLWPFTKEKIDIFMRNQLQNSIRKNLPSTLQSFTFTSIELGSQVPQVLAVDVKDNDKEYIILDIEILYHSDADIGLSIGRVESSINDLQVHGTLRVVLTELNTSWPFFGKMNLSFVTAPQLSFRLAKAASIFNIAGFRDIIHESICDQLTSLLVLPHYLTIPVNNNYKSSTSYPQPQGVLRIHVNRAKDLPRNDQTDSIDPYCIIQVGAIRCKSGIIQKTDHPMWNEAFEFLVNDMDNQYVEVQCIDAADTQGIGSLGSCYVNISSLVGSSGKNIWLTLDKSTGGSVSITPTWLQLAEDMSKISQPEMVGCQWKSIALLTVGVESAEAIPKGLRSLSKPSSFVRVSVDSKEYDTRVVQAADCPSWGENFYFLSSNPNKQDVTFEIIDNITASVLGTVCIPLADLTKSPTLVTQKYQLEKCTNPDATITLGLSLKALIDADPVLTKPARTSNGNVELNSASSVSLTTMTSLPTSATSPLTVSTPIKLTKPVVKPLVPKIENDSSSGGHSDLLDFDNWSETDSNVITGGSTYIVISRPDGSTVSEIVQKADESTTCTKENINLDESKFGKIQITLRYSTTQQKLMIAIHQCCNLTPLKRDKEASPDPYVVLTLYNGRKKVDRKETKNQKATLNPVFDETFEFKLLKPNVENALVELSIKNKKGKFQKGKTSLGSVLLRISALDLSEARTDWFLVRSMKESAESLPDMTQSFSSRS